MDFMQEKTALHTRPNNNEIPMQIFYSNLYLNYEIVATYIDNYSGFEFNKNSKSLSIYPSMVILRQRIFRTINVRL